MNSGKSDASTSTDDVKGPPLCLFYFTHPFGVLSPEPPSVGPAPAHFARAFFNMEPVSPFHWPSSSGGPESQRSTATFEWEAGEASEPTLSSSLVSWAGEAWLGAAGARRLLPYHRTLPPLRLPAPARALSPREDAWPRRARPPDKLSLPPIELPALAARAPAASAGSGARAHRPREAREPRRRAVRKLRRRRADVRRLLAGLVRRACRLTEGAARAAAGPEPALRRVLRTIRDAWPEPADLYHRCRAVSQAREPPPAPAHAAHPTSRTDTMTSLEPPPTPRRHAAPPLLCRRYSLPETIMRKYRLAQRRPDTEESGAAGPTTAASASATPPREESPHRFLRRDRELMRKSALLRRMWARPCRCADTRSLDGSRSELRRVSPLPLDAAAPDPPRSTDFGLASCADTASQSFPRAGRDSPLSMEPAPLSTERLSEPAPLERKSGRSPSDADDRIHDRFRSDSDAFSARVSTARATDGSSDAFLRRDGTLSVDGPIEVSTSENYIGEDEEERDAFAYGPPIGSVAPPHSFEILEIVISETVDRRDSGGGLVTPIGSSLAVSDPRDLDVDEYVSSVLVESLNSLSDRLECMNASIGADRRISVVEKEIKVKLQNAGVNTIVHLSPTSNNQIIFGNEELCHDGRRSLAVDECDGPPSVTIREELHGGESDEEPPLPPPCPRPLAAAAPPFVSLLHHDNVNGAVLRQIQKLFRDGLRDLDESDRPADATLGISHVEISDVDVYVDRRVDPGRTEAIARGDADRIGGVGAGNYFRDDSDAVAVPRFSAYPHTDSMEVNASSSEDAEAACSECASLVDSLDDPASPRYRAVMARAPRRAELARSAVDVLELLPEAGAPERREADRAEAFFVRFRDDVRDRLEDDVTVAEYMPETIRQRLYRRHRKRELRMECARRSKVKQLKKELERRRREDVARARRDVERDCAAIVEALLDDVIARMARDECGRARAEGRGAAPVTVVSEESLFKRNRRRDVEEREREAVRNATNLRRSSDGVRHQRSELRQVLAERPKRLSSGDRPPRRIYQKSEIREGEKCIEILEILEYANGSQSSPETSNSDENHNRTSGRKKKSRIPVPVNEKSSGERSVSDRRPSGGDGDRMRLTGGDGQASPRAAPPPEPRSRSNSLRFKRVFDMIPEERSSLSVDSSCEEAPPAPALPAATRSAATSPAVAPARRRSATTMTSPRTRSAATSPLHAPPPPPPPREGIVPALRPHRTAPILVE